MSKETLIVVWEGTDGSGKTSLMQAVKDLLVKKGYRVGTYKTPGDTQTGRFALKYGNTQGVDGFTRMLLFAANTADDSKLVRMQLDNLRPHFEFIDRYYLCSVVYGVAILKTKHGKAVSIEDVETLLRLFEKLGRDIFVRPDLYVIVDVEEEVRLRRAISKSGKTCSADLSYELDSHLQEEVRNLYKLLIERGAVKAIWVNNAENKLKENAILLADKLVELRESVS
ncbi:MAG: dTMP kinase [Nitrososphaerota archaeon]|nr:dTMP kinase [Nitrososphaerota archaeon]